MPEDQPNLWKISTIGSLASVGFLIFWVAPVTLFIALLVFTALAVGHFTGYNQEVPGVSKLPAEWQVGPALASWSAAAIMISVGFLPLILYIVISLIMFTVGMFIVQDYYLREEQSDEDFQDQD